MPYNRQIPDAPVAPSMLPRAAAADLTSQDVLVLTQPGNNPGQKNKGLELGALFGAPFAALDYAAGAAPKFYEFTYDGPIPRTGVAPGKPGSNTVGTRIAYLEVPFKHQAIFWIDGYSGTATTTGDQHDYTYALRITARSLWSPHDDEYHDLFFPCFTGLKQMSEGEIGYEPTIYFPSVGNKVPYTARGQWWLHNPAHGADIPDTVTKELSLFAFGGGSNSPYQAIDPASYHLNIHVLVFPDHKYDFPAG